MTATKPKLTRSFIPVWMTHHHPVYDLEVRRRGFGAQVHVGRRAAAAEAVAQADLGAVEHAVAVRVVIQGVDQRVVVEVFERHRVGAVPGELTFGTGRSEDGARPVPAGATRSPD